MKNVYVPLQIQAAHLKSQGYRKGLTIFEEPFKSGLEFKKFRLEYKDQILHDFLNAMKNFFVNLYKFEPSTSYSNLCLFNRTILQEKIFPGVKYLKIASSLPFDFYYPIELRLGRRENIRKSGLYDRLISKTLQQYCTLLIKEKMNKISVIQRNLFRDDVKRVDEGIFEEITKSPIFLHVLNIGLRSIRESIANLPCTYHIEIVQQRDIEISNWIKRIIKVVVDEISFEESKKLWDIISNTFEDRIQKYFSQEQEITKEAIQKIKIYVISKEVAEFI